jgi:hypothetical protein
MVSQRRMRGKMKHRSLPTTALAGFIFAAALSVATVRPLRADNAVQTQTINLHAGQARIIDHLKIDSKPVIRVIENPYALVVHGETPGQLLLLGADRGHWEITVTREDGAQVAYEVAVAAIADRATPLDPGTGPVASSDAAFRGPVATSANPGGPSETVRPTGVVDAFSSDVVPQDHSFNGDKRPAVSYR